MQLIETLAVVIGVVLVLALATQSLQELLKVMWPVKAQARLALIRGLIEESTLATGLHLDDARALSGEIVQRLQGLGLRGVRKSAVRVDALGIEQLKTLIADVNPALVPGLSVYGTVAGQPKQDKQLKRIAEKAEALYPLAMSVVDARTTRRMRVFSLVTSAIVVIGLNVDALSLWARVDADSKVREELLEAVGEIHELQLRLSESASIGVETDDATGETANDQDAAGVDESTNDDDAAGGEEQSEDGSGAAADSDPPTPSTQALVESQEELDAALRRVFSGGLLADLSDRHWNDQNWWLGIALMTLLVSLGMPFWHETLGALLGLRKRWSEPGKPKS